MRPDRAVDRFRQTRLYVLITEAFCRGPWLDTAAAALTGGAGALQLREKTLSDPELLERGRTLLALCRHHGALLIINDRADIARAVGADGVHVGQGDLTVSAARQVLGPAGLVGVSTHTHQQASAAIALNPDYIAAGPMFPSQTKPAEHIAGPIFLAAVRSMTALPIVAIGGINATNAALLGAADTLAVCQAVTASADPAEAARALLAERAILG